MGRVATDRDRGDRGGRLRPLRALSRSLLVTALLVVAALVSVARANADTASEYHEVARFGGFDESGFNFGSYERPLTPGKFLEPTGFAVDAQEGNAVYIADRTSSVESVSPAWRIQKLSSTGTVLGTTTFTLSGGIRRSSSIVGLAVDHHAGRLYALIMGPVRAGDPYYEKATAAQELLAWSTAPVAGGLVAATEIAGEPPLEADPLAASTGQGTVGAVVSSEAQLEPSSGTPLYDPQGIVVDRLETPSVDNPIAIEASDLSLSKPETVNQRNEGAYEDEQNGNTIVQQVSTQGTVGELLTKWSSASVAGELGPMTGAPRGISEDPDGSISVLLHASELSTTNTYVVRLSPELGKPLVLDRDLSEPQAVMRLDPGPFFTAEPGSPYDETMNAGPEFAQLSNGLYAGDLYFEKLPFRSPSYWRSELGEEGTNIGVRLLEAGASGEISGPRGETIVNTLGDETSPCHLGAQEAALAAGADGTLWVLDRGPTSASLLEHSGELQPGREVVEFALEAGTQQERCPQPSGTFTVGLSSRGSACGASQSGAEPITVSAGAEVVFDASTIKIPNATKEHPNGTAFGYEWEFGDGSAGSHTSEVSETHIFTQPGTYTVNLKLSSDYGIYTPPPATVIVTPAQGLTPRAQFTVTSLVAQRATFDAAGSTAGICKTIVDYLWNWGDGSSPESDSPQTPVVAHVYAAAGNYTVTLTVINSDFQSAVSAPQAVDVSTVEQPPILIEPLPTPPSAQQPAPALPAAPDRSPTDLSPHATFSGGVLNVDVACPATKVLCAGTLRLETAEAFSAGVAKSGGARSGGLKSKASKLLLGQASFSFVGGVHKALAVRLTSTGLALLRRLRRLPALMVVTAHDSLGDPGTATLRLTLAASVARHSAVKRKSRSKHPSRGTK